MAEKVSAIVKHFLSTMIQDRDQIFWDGRLHGKLFFYLISHVGGERKPPPTTLIHRTEVPIIITEFLTV